MWLILAFRGGASVQGEAAQPDVFPSSLEAASRQREEVSSAYMWICEWRGRAIREGAGGRAGGQERAGGRAGGRAGWEESYLALQQQRACWRAKMVFSEALR